MLSRSNIIISFINVYILSSYECITASLVGIGGHELFSSLAQVKLLWYNELETVQILEKIVDKLDDPPIQLMR